MQHTSVWQRSALAAIVIAALATVLMTQILVLGHGSAPSLALPVPAADLAAQLGVSVTAATKLMNAFGSWYFTILIAAATGGWGAGLVAVAKSLAAKFGKKYAIAW